MNYRWHYNHLIETRKIRVKEEGKYYERHHILPTSMGGLNSPENIVYLTAREHFLAHWLLWRIHRNREMSIAFWCMTTYKNKKTQGICRNFSSRAFEEARESKALTFVSDETRYKNGNGRRGKKISQETKNKIGKSNSGKVRSDEFKHRLSEVIKGKTYEELMGIDASQAKKLKISNSLKGRVFSEHHRKNLSESQRGKKLSTEHKEKLSTILKGKIHPHIGTSGKVSCNIEYKCPYCSKKGKGPSVLRWHFNNCKFKNNVT